jgi:hypothetical protein
MNEITIVEARMTHSKEDGYIGNVVFQFEQHPKPYEITLHSKSRRDWSYSLSFAKESGSEELIEQVEDALEEDDELFDALVEAASQQLAANPS